MNSNSPTHVITVISLGVRRDDYFRDPQLEADTQIPLGSINEDHVWYTVPSTNISTVGKYEQRKL